MLILAVNGADTDVVHWGKFRSVTAKVFLPVRCVGEVIIIIIITVTFKVA